MNAATAARVRDRVPGLISYLRGEGLLHDRMWEAALHEVPRHLFVPDRAWAASNAWRGSSRAIDRRANAVDWWNACYEPASIITQRDDGERPADEQRGTPTCSLSSPSISVPYLELLGLADHHRVLEIGTGTGWTAAVLAWRLGDAGQVVSIEVDKQLAETAEENLERAGQAPIVRCGDGADGWADGGLYDRVHVTCGVRDIPFAWVEQTRPGGVIVLPWMPHPGQYGQQLRLDVLDDGTAVGGFCGGGGFMMLRSQRAGAVESPVEGRESVTEFDPRALATEGAQLALATAAPGLAWADDGRRESGRWVHGVVLWDLAGDSTASVRQDPGGPWRVVEAGPRDLWAEAQVAYMGWARAGRPGRDRYRMVVGPEGQRLELAPGH